MTLMNHTLMNHTLSTKSLSPASRLARRPCFRVQYFAVMHCTSATYFDNNDVSHFTGVSVVTDVTGGMDTTDVTGVSAVIYMKG